MQLVEQGDWESPETPFFTLSANAWAMVALEGWRRGLTLTLEPNRSFTLSDEAHSLRFRLSRLDRPSNRESNRTVSDKEATKQLLRIADVSTPEGRAYVAPFNRGSIRQYAAELGYPVALKANNWSKGKGVFSRLSDDATFSPHLDELIDDLECKHLIVERYIPGLDYRFYVVGEEVVAVTRRAPANVTGDGTSTISQLIATKNQSRKLNPYLRNSSIKVDSEVTRILREQSLDTDTILPVGHTVHLREKSNVSAGGDSIDYTNEASPSTKRLAVEAIKAIPGLSHGGVDLLVADIGQATEAASVLEINAAAELGLHLFPATGASRDVSTALVSYYFPDANPKQPETACWYFDHDFIQSALSRGSVASITATSIPKLAVTKWIEAAYTGNVQGVGFRRWLAQHAKSAKLHGTVRNQPDGTVLARLCGTRRGVQMFLSSTSDAPHPARIDNMRLLDIPPFPIVPGIQTR